MPLRRGAMDRIVAHTLEGIYSAQMAVGRNAREALRRVT